MKSSKPLQVRVRRVGDAVVLDLAGPLLLGDAVESLHAHIQQMLSEGVRNLAVNLTEVPKLDSSGMGALIRAYTTVKKNGGSMRTFAASEGVRQMLKMVRLDTVLELSEDEASALAGF
jgi:anti-sigma B factor antagonist